MTRRLPRMLGLAELTPNETLLVTDQAARSTCRRPAWLAGLR
jgi:hypothetical protein